ncbi:MAG: hypothetical protein GF383_00990 [Candidatus Lokiarchaeota archaeon]|nr:hypothetical protein [Candidatus Lokiarchaeota archaeon]MBD3337789.1 hypothetical protein [Candidatus Lokiarchaeota archaeon]
MEDFLKSAQAAFPIIDGSEKVNGLQKEVDILWDKWGIPHIFAETMEDACLSMGYVHARHRMWQLELFRRLISGELSEIVGKGALKSDMHYRIIGLHRVARSCAKRLKNANSDVSRALLAYVGGVNQGIQKMTQNPPIEFKLLELPIEPWRLEDSLKIILLIDWGLSKWNYPLELLRDKLIEKLGVNKADKIMPLYSGVTFQNPTGSNSWAVSPKKSKLGSALLANDPHLPLSLPAIWFLAHINYPGFNSIGSTFPGLPMIVLGHNEKIAWGCTNVHADTIDLFRLEINPNNKNQYKYNGQWIDFGVIEEPIEIKEDDNLNEFKVLTTKFGPIVKFYELDDEIYEIVSDDSFALRWSSFETRLENTIKGFFLINNASNWDQFRDGLKWLTINPQNFIYADLEGNIGLHHGGKIPVRKYGDGAMVTPGIDDKYNWERMSSFEEMWNVFNPEEGFLCNANYNEEKAPEGILLAQDRSEPFRQIRIKNLLQSKEKISFEDFIAFQLDYYTEEAALLLPQMLKYLKKNEDIAKLTDLVEFLENWDYELTKQTIGGTLYKIWVEQTIKSILIPLIGEDILNQYMGSCPFELNRLFELFENDDEKLSDLLFRSFQNTLAFLEKKLSVDVNKWKWGSLHKLTLTHPFSLADPKARVLNIGPFKFGGDTNTLNNGYYDPLNDYQVIVGPSFRQIHEFTNWDKSVWMLPGGQSGLAFHKHYADLIKLYLKGDYIPMLYSRKAISKHLEGELKLIST